MTTARAESPDGVVTSLYLRTKTLHVEAERTGIIRDLLRGEASREGYALLLRNLLPAYQAMEQGLERHLHTPGVGVLGSLQGWTVRPRSNRICWRCAATHWSDELPLLAAGESLCATNCKGFRRRRLTTDRTRLYPLSRRPQRRPDPAAVAGAVAGTAAGRTHLLRFSALFRSRRAEGGLSQGAGSRRCIVAADRRALVEEAAIAFSLNIDLSCAVQASAALRRPAASSAAE